MIPRQTSLSQHIVHFARFLRQHQFTVGVEEESAALEALQFIDYKSRKIFALTLKTIFCRSKSQLDAFDELFDEYWKQLRKAADSKIKDKKSPAAPTISSQPFQSLKAWLHGNRNEEEMETSAYSTHENLSRKDFSAVPPEDVEELMQLIKTVARRLAAKTSRRYESSHRINLPDLRKTIRNNLRSGGEILEIKHRQPKKNRLKLVLICDVSRSMELYATFFLQFMFAFQQVYSRMETFVFSTSLHRITTALKQADFADARKLLSKYEMGWSGGTKIGEALESFMQQYSRQLIDRNTIVIIVSDGWDTGSTDKLEENMRSLKRKAKRIIWLNPLAGYENYHPTTAGMRAALPFTDVFASVHSVESMAQLSRWL